MAKFDINATPFTVYTPSDGGVAGEGLNASERATFRSEMEIPSNSELAAVSDVADAAQDTANAACPDSEAVKKTGDQSINGVKTFNSFPTIYVPTSHTYSSNEIMRYSDISNLVNALKPDVSSVDVGYDVSYTANYASKTGYIVTTASNTDIDITISNVTEGSTNWLKIIKPSGTTISFTGINGTIDGWQTPKTSVTFRVYKIDGAVICEQISEYSGSLSETDLSVVSPWSMGTFYYFNWYVTNKRCTLEARFALSTTTAGLNSAEINLSDFPIIPANDYVPFNIYTTDFTRHYVGRLNGSDILFRCEDTDSFVIDTLVLSATFKIEK